MFKVLNFFVRLIRFVFIVYWNSDYPAIGYLLPNIFKDDLIAIASNDSVIAIPGILAMTIIYLCVAWIIFRRRNI